MKKNRAFSGKIGLENDDKKEQLRTQNSRTSISVEENKMLRVAMFGGCQSINHGPACVVRGPLPVLLCVQYLHFYVSHVSSFFFIFIILNINVDVLRGSEVSEYCFLDRIRIRILFGIRI